MEMRDSNCPIPSAISHRGADVAAACGPLQLIAASLLASCQDSKQATQQLCNLLVTSKVFAQALQGCQGLLPVTFGPPATAEAAAAFAGGRTVACGGSQQYRPVDVAVVSATSSLHPLCILIKRPLFILLVGHSCMLHRCCHA